VHLGILHHEGENVNLRRHSSTRSIRTIPIERICVSYFLFGSLLDSIQFHIEVLEGGEWKLTNLRSNAKLKARISFLPLRNQNCTCIPRCIAV
jgi:hypothetical protein